MKFITNRTLGIDVETGLSKELRFVSVIIDSEAEQLVVGYKVVLVSPTGVDMKTLHTGIFTRYNSQNNPEYDNLRESPIGQGIIQILQADLNLFDETQEANNFSLNQIP